MTEIIFPIIFFLIIPIFSTTAPTFGLVVVPFGLVVVPFGLVVVPFGLVVVPFGLAVVPFGLVVVPFGLVVVPFGLVVVPLIHGRGGGGVESRLTLWVTDIILPSCSSLSLTGAEFTRTKTPKAKINRLAIGLICK